MITRISIILLLLAVAGCARMEPPLPPLKRLPGPPLKMTAVQEGDTIVVTGTLPAANRDGSSIEAYRQLEITGFLESLTGDTEPTGPVPLLQLAEKELNGRLTGRTFRVVVTDLDRRLGLDRWPDEARLTMTIRFQNERNKWSEPARLPAVPVAVAAAPPRRVTAQVEKQGVVLTWESASVNFNGSRPPVSDGVVIHRRQLPDGPVTEIGRVAPADRRFTDEHFAVGQEFAYALSSFRNVGDDEVFGGKSEWQQVNTRDVFGPEPPQSVTIVLDENRIKLLWDPVPDKDLAGYRVYRRGSREESFRRLTRQLLEFPSFTDETADPAGEYVYVVTAVDTSGNESPRSAEVVFPHK
ncbi:MAG: fibronectin type III domain-containing protein [Acidobacteria bacterium]|nr:fibronectin type III domain-containing protein [Acidobacteriota bacterium]